MKNELAIGPVMIDIEGTTLNQIDQEKIAHPNTGALILFTRNFENSYQISSLIKQIRKSRKGPMLLAVDQEGGRVQRFRKDFTRLPAAKAYADKPELTTPAGWLMATELLASGVDFSFAPVLDIDCGISEIIGDRCFSPELDLAIRLASNFRQGMHEAGMAAVGKHFPGHGGVALDSHLTLPTDERSLDDLRLKDLLPFQQLISEGIEGIMTAHVVYPHIDSLPAGFSSIWIQQVLRQELAFDGAVFSDDLNMQGAAVVGDFKDRASLALQAGCDMVLVCNNPAGAEQVLDALPIKPSSERQRRLQCMIGKPQMDSSQLPGNEQWQQLAMQIQQLTEV